LLYFFAPRDRASAAGIRTVVTQRWRTIARVAQTAVVAVVVGVSFVYLWRSIDARLLGATVLGARMLPLATAVALVVPAAILRTLYWRALLAPLDVVRFRVLLTYTLACNAANVLLPARAGEAMRAWLLRSRHGIPLSTSAAVVVAEKAGDLLALAALVLPLPWLLADVPNVVARALQVVLAIVFVVMMLLALASRSATRFRWLAGVESLRRPAILARGFGAIALCWLVELTTVLLVMSAVGVPPRLESALLVLLYVNLATAIPATPGQLGTHEIASAAALRLQGAAPEEAVAFALLYHGAQLVPALALGLLDARTMLTWRRTASA
jgi:glycosyltransferase 2 family protein